MHVLIKKTFVASAVSALLFGPAAGATEEWRVELMPYLWAAGVNGDVAVRNRAVEIDASFSDVADSLDVGGALLMHAQRGPWVLWTQVDYLSISTDELEDGPERGTLNQDVTMATLGAGYQFASTDGRRSIDVLLGVRHLSVDTELRLRDSGRFGQDRDATDPVIILRPSFQFAEKWRFNPTLSYGAGGDSEKVWELQPQIQYRTSEHTALRFGYRRLQYELESEKGSSFDGSFEGPFVGFGGVFGGTP